MLKSFIKNTLVLTYWTYKSGLIQSYTLPYVRMMAGHLDSGYRIVLVTLEQPSMALDRAEAAAEREALAKDRIDWITFPYNRFGLAACLQAALSLAVLFRLCLRERVSMIHCFCTPAGALGYLLSVLTGIPMVIDSYEPHAEAMVESGTWTANSLKVRLLSLFERLQSRRAEAVVAVTESMRGYARVRYGAVFEKYYVKPACVDLGRFDPKLVDGTRLRRELGFDGKIVCVYAGKVGGIYLKREIFEWLRVAQERWGERFRALILTSDPPALLARLSVEAGFDASALVSRFIEHCEMPRHLAVADFAITPVRPLPCKRHCTPIKDGEYWAMGLPIIIPRGISDDSDIVRLERIGVVLADVSKASFAEALETLESMGLAQPSADDRRRIRAVAARERGLERASSVYRKLYCGLLSIS